MKLNCCVGAGPHLAEDLLGVRLQLGTQLHPGQVSLQQQVGLHMGVVELGVVQFVGHLLRQLEDRKQMQHPQFGRFLISDLHKWRIITVVSAHLSEKRVLVMADGNVLVLGSVGDDLDESADLCLGVQGHAEQLCQMATHNR